MLGEFLCKMYLFIQSLSSTASILILVAICVERYFAIIYPITSKQILTPKRLKIKILLVWIASIGYSSPKFIWGRTIVNEFSNGNGIETMCILNRQLYNSKLTDMCHFVLLYCIPLLIITLLYTRIAFCLWRSSQQVRNQFDASNEHANRQNGRTTKSDNIASEKRLLRTPSSTAHNPTSSQNVLRARRGVIRMLIIVVFAFALCHLPFHARKIWQYWSTSYHGATDFSAL
ncbi:hypothetical protein WA026_017049 [Henosepilachna vigintioctopunctata]|uniref:G-protein coupled receptors family 1 profile domain-containing protein n=1 Tax=Henosepilachna vigintioctopunctata TaxID=420089 RepID=A0AAW1TUA0_9CUCU